MYFLNDPCSTRTNSIDLRKYHTRVASISFCLSLEIFAIGGDELDTKNNKYSSSLSIWKIKDDYPFYELLFCNKLPTNNFGFFNLFKLKTSRILLI